MTARFDTIVIGVGGMGSATVYQLAAREQRVLGIEQFDIPHSQGSSHGVNRIIRLAYFEHPSYVPLLWRAFELWREIEFRVNQRLLVVTGALDIGTAESETITGSLRSCNEWHLRHKLLDHNDVARRFPGYQLPAGHVAVHQPEGGFVMSEQAIVAHVMAALDLGAEVHGRERVMEWHPDGDGVAVRTDRDSYWARRVVITAGAWIGQVVPALARVATPERQVLAWFQPRRPERFDPRTFPVYNGEFEEGRFYGFPVYGVPGYKLGKYHHQREIVDPDRARREPDAIDEQMLRQFAERYFPDGAGATLALRTCLFTNTPDEHFIIGPLPAEPRVIVASPCSGHGYKFCGVIGEILADLAIDGGTRHDIGLFDPARFG